MIGYSCPSCGKVLTKTTYRNSLGQPDYECVCGFRDNVRFLKGHKIKPNIEVKLTGKYSSEAGYKASKEHKDYLFEERN